MWNSVRNSLIAVATCAFFAASGLALAAPTNVGPATVPGFPPDPTYCQLETTLEDNVHNTGITVDEYGCFTDRFGTEQEGGYYDLFNPSTSGVSIFGLAVTTEDYFESPGFFGPGTEVDGWFAQFWDEAFWNANIGQSFSDTFGNNPNVDGIYLYMIEVPPIGALAPGDSVTGHTGFFFGTAPNTQFAALNNGQVIAQSFVAPTQPPGGVPIPGTLALLGLGLLSTLVRRRV
uniref:PEP-CTERM protein-sorting domain-containing protein n=1 Tax=Haliea sp. ETY-M TaxID=1055105 RepID=A0A455R305_9GAMM|nr:hypothetical protein [Haliea sp. ETY-M]